MYMYMYFPFVFSFSFFIREKKQQNYLGRKSVTMIGSITNLMSSLESDLTWEAEVSDSDPSTLRASASPLDHSFIMNELLLKLSL